MLSKNANLTRWIEPQSTIFPSLEELMAKIALGEFDWEEIHYQVGTVGLGKWGQLCLQAFSSVKDTVEYQRWAARRERELEKDLASSPSTLPAWTKSSVPQKWREPYAGRYSSRPCHSYSKSRLRHRPYKTSSADRNTSNNFSSLDQVDFSSMKEIKEFANGEVVVHDVSDLSDCESFTTCDSSQSDSETKGCLYSDSGDADCSDIDDDRPYCSRWSQDVVDDVLRWHIDKYIESVDEQTTDISPANNMYRSPFSNIKHQYNGDWESSNDDSQYCESPKTPEQNVQDRDNFSITNHKFKLAESPQASNEDFQYIFPRSNCIFQLEEYQGSLNCFHPTEGQHNQNLDLQRSQKPASCQSLLNEDRAAASSGCSQTMENGDLVSSLIQSLDETVDEDKLTDQCHLHVDSVHRLELESKIVTCLESKEGQGCSLPASLQVIEPNTEDATSDLWQDVTVTFQHMTSPVKLADDSVRPRDGGHTVRCVASLETVLREVEQGRQCQEQVYQQKYLSEGTNISMKRRGQNIDQRCPGACKMDERRTHICSSKHTSNEGLFPDTKASRQTVSFNKLFDESGIGLSSDQEEYESATEDSEVTFSIGVEAGQAICEPSLPGVVNENGQVRSWNSKEQQSRGIENERLVGLTKVKGDSQYLNWSDGVDWSVDFKTKLNEVVTSLEADDIYCRLGQEEDKAEGWSKAEDKAAAADDHSRVCPEEGWSAAHDKVCHEGISIMDKSVHDSELELDVILLEGSVPIQQTNDINVKIRDETTMNLAKGPQRDKCQKGETTFSADGCNIS